MKFIHISDLHIGKRVHEFSMIEEQKFILKQIVDIAVEHEVDALLISGDIYDKTVPTVEAVDVFDDFITDISEKGIIVIAISGNHDSPERIDYGSRIMKKNNVHIIGDYKGKIPVVTLEDAYGKVNFYPMPYLKPGMVNKRLGVQTKTFDECVRAAIEHENINEAERNILLAHQFVTASGVSPERSESEIKSLGGTDNVDAAAFELFDYVALGHIHRPQKIGREQVRYSGSPLKYSFSECRHKKSVVIVECREKGDLSYQLEPLEPMKDMQEIRCTLEELRTGKYENQVPADTYVHITLTDEEEILDAIGKVRDVYPNVMLLDFDNNRMKRNENRAAFTSDDLKEKTPVELFESFFAGQHNETPMTDLQKQVFTEIIDGRKGGQA